MPWLSSRGIGGGGGGGICLGMKGKVHVGDFSEDCEVKCCVVCGSYRKRNSEEEFTKGGIEWVVVDVQYGK